MQDLILTLIPVVVAGLTQTVVEGLQKFVTLLDRLPAIAKQVIVVVVAFALTKAAAFLGVTLTSTDLALIGSQDVQALLSAALAFVFHSQFKAKAAAR